MTHMQATLHSVRVYWSEGGYGEPRETPAGGPLCTPDYPCPGDRLSVHFGEVPDGIRQQLRLRFALLNLYGNRLTGNPTKTGDEGVEEELENVDLPFDKHRWYVTMVIERPTSVDEGKLTGERYVWIDPWEIDEAQHALEVDAQVAFDTATGVIAPLVQGQMFEGQTVPLATYLSANGLGPALMPRFSGSADGRGIHAISAFPHDAVRSRIGALGEHGDSWAWLALPAHWYAAMLGELKDRYKRFLWGFIALEALTIAVFERADPAPDRSEKQKQKMAISTRFEHVARHLSPGSAVDDVAVFKRAAKARNDLAHGNERLRELDLPTEAIEALLPRYLNMALEADSAG